MMMMERRKRMPVIKVSARSVMVTTTVHLPAEKYTRCSSGYSLVSQSLHESALNDVAAHLLDKDVSVSDISRGL